MKMKWQMKITMVITGQEYDNDNGVNSAGAGKAATKVTMFGSGRTIIARNTRPQAGSGGGARKAESTQHCAQQNPPLKPARRRRRRPPQHQVPDALRARAAHGLRSGGGCDHPEPGDELLDDDHPVLRRQTKRPHNTCDILYFPCELFTDQLTLHASDFDELSRISQFPH